MNVNPLTALVGILDAARVRLLALDSLRAEREGAALAADAWTQRKAVHARVQDGLAHATVLLETSLHSDLRALERTDLATCAATAEQRRANAVAVLGHIAGQLDAYPPARMADIQIRWDYADDHAWRERLASQVLTDARAVETKRRLVAEVIAYHVPPTAAAVPRCAWCRMPVLDDRFTRLGEGEIRHFCSTACLAESHARELDAATLGEDDDPDDRQELEVAELRATLDAADGYDAPDPVGNPF